MAPSIISHSEVDQFLACERRHYYAFGKPTIDEDGNPATGLEPKNVSDGLFRGNAGHLALETYYKHLAPHSIKGVPSDEVFAEAKKLALATVTGAMATNPERMDMLLGLHVVLNAYFDYWLNDSNGDRNWQFLAVETELREVIDGDIEFPFKPDLIKRHRYNGRVVVVDHKFLANLYTPQEIAIQPQLAKYVGALRNLGYEVDDAEYDLVCHRVLKTKPYDSAQSLRRIPLKLTKKRIETSLEEQHSVVRSIALFKSEPEIWAQEVRRAANSYNCKHCSFLNMCVADLNGEDTSVMARYEFRANTYGYDKKNEVEV